MRVENVVVANYSEDWAKEFEKSNRYLKKISADIIRIEHVGSTSVEGLCAKPIIDIDIVIEDYSKFEAVKSGLASLGYEYEGDLGITEREAFSMKLIKKSIYGAPYLCMSKAFCRIKPSCHFSRSS